MKLANSFLTIPLISIWGFYAMWFGQVDTLLQQSLHPLIASLLTLKLLLHFLFSSNKPSVCCSGSLGNGTYPVLCKSYLEMILLKKSYFFLSQKSSNANSLSALGTSSLCWNFVWLSLYKPCTYFYNHCLYRCNFSILLGKKMFSWC